MSDPVREQHERDGFVSSTPFPKGTMPDQTPEAHYLPEDDHRPPVLGVLLAFIAVFWTCLIAAFFLLR
jgi:hypothetical protein